jgi:hypothetical protein
VDLLLRILLAMVAVALVGYPLIRQSRESDDVESMEDTAQLHHRKESAYAALKELEFDYRTGKLSEADYHELEAKYRTEGLEVLQQIEALDGGDRTEPPRVLRQVKTPAGRPGSCEACGEQNPRAAAYCRECGSALPTVPVHWSPT